MRNNVEVRDHEGLKRLVWIALAVSFLAVLMLAQPSQAKAAVVCPPGTANLLPPGKSKCRPVCESPAKVLTATPGGIGTGSFSATARNLFDPAQYDFKGDPECAVPAGTNKWNVKAWCAQNPAFHCIHWHTYLKYKQGIPVPATATVSAVPNGGSFFYGWSSNCLPSQDPDISRNACSIRMDAAKTVTGTFGIEADTVAPTKPTLTVQKVKIGSVKLTFTGVSDDHNWWVYEIYRNGVLYAQHPRAAMTTTSLTLTGQLCKTTYTWEVRAYDTGGFTASDPVDIFMGNDCPKPPPPGTEFHIKPPKVTKQRSAFFHWGPLWQPGQKTTSVKYQCKLGKQSWKKCFPGKTYKNLKPGYHTFRVRAGNVNGWDPTPAKFTWKIKK